MATRTVKLRLQVPRNDGTAHRKALWTTHQVINEAAAYYESYLLQMRQPKFIKTDRLLKMSYLKRRKKIYRNATLVGWNQLCAA